MIGNNDRMDDATIVSRREPEHIGLLRWRRDTIKVRSQSGAGRRDDRKTELLKDGTIKRDDQLNAVDAAYDDRHDRAPVGDI